jgi:hypothetical protein
MRHVGSIFSYIADGIAWFWHFFPPCDALNCSRATAIQKGVACRGGRAERAGG